MKDQKITGEEPAFPAAGSPIIQEGITLKQYYVGQALAGLCSRGLGDPNNYAEAALDIADAVIFYLNSEL